MKLRKVALMSLTTTFTDYTIKNQQELRIESRLFFYAKN